MTDTPQVRLMLGEQDIELRWTDAGGAAQSRSLPIGLARLAQAHRFGRPVNALALEAAIESIEDAVMPLAREMPPGARLAVAASPVPAGLRPALGADADAATAATFGLDAVETAFTALAALAQGRPVSQSPVPDTPDFAAALLVLREVMHHLGLHEACFITPDATA